MALPWEVTLMSADSKTVGGLDTIALVSGWQQGHSLVLHVAWQLPGHTRAEQHLTCGPKSLPCGQPLVHQLLWLRSAAQQGDCDIQCFFSPLQDCSAGLCSNSSGRLAAGRLPWCAVSLVGEGGLSRLWHSLWWPQLALCGQCLAAL